MRPPDFRMEVWGFVVALNLGEQLVCRLICGACDEELVVASPKALLPPAYDLSADLRAVRWHYEEKHRELELPAASVGVSRRGERSDG